MFPIPWASVIVKSFTALMTPHVNMVANTNTIKMINTVVSFIALSCYENNFQSRGLNLITMAKQIAQTIPAASSIAKPNQFKNIASAIVEHK